MKMIKPMLAHKYNPEKADYPAYIQPKLDGVRCIFTKDSAYSRTGKEFKNVDHIKKNLTSVFNKYPNIILDGELYNHGLKDDFEKIISLVRKTKPTEEHRQKAVKQLPYHPYDDVLNLTNYQHKIKVSPTIYRNDTLGIPYPWHGFQESLLFYLAVILLLGAILFRVCR